MAVKLPVFFRLDGSLTIGFGHFYRCQVLAYFFKSMGHEVTFVTRDLGDDLRSLIASRGFGHQTIESKKELQAELEHGWNADLQEDVSETARIADKGILICDHYGYGPLAFSFLRRSVSCLVSFDDAADRHYPVDFVVNTNYGAQNLSFSKEENTKVLAGSSYALIRSEFFEVKNNQPKEQLVLFFGATDPENLTRKVAEQLLATGIPMTLVLGKGNPHATELQAKFSAQSSVEVLVNSPRVEKVFSEARLVVAAAGSVVWELAFLEKPMVLLKTTANQKNLMDELLKVKAIIELPSLKDAEKIISSVYHDEKKLEALREHIHGVVDGLGKERIYKAIVGESRVKA